MRVGHRRHRVRLLRFQHEPHVVPILLVGVAHDDVQRLLRMGERELQALQRGPSGSGRSAPARRQSGPRARCRSAPAQAHRTRRGSNCTTSKPSLRRVSGSFDLNTASTSTLPCTRMRGSKPTRTSCNQPAVHAGGIRDGQVLGRQADAVADRAALPVTRAFDAGVGECDEGLLPALPEQCNGTDRDAWIGTPLQHRAGGGGGHVDVPGQQKLQVLAGGVVDGHVQPLLGEVAPLQRHVGGPRTAVGLRLEPRHEDHRARRLRRRRRAGIRCAFHAAGCQRRVGGRYRERRRQQPQPPTPPAAARCRQPLPR